MPAPVTRRGSGVSWRKRLAERPNQLRLGTIGDWLAVDPIAECYRESGAGVSAIFAPREPSGFSALSVVSRSVYRSISAFKQAPSSTT